MPDFQLHSVALYFSPPIVPGLQVNYAKRFGGRYLAGLFGSLIPSVLSIGVLSCSYGAVVFTGGREHWPMFYLISPAKALAIVAGVCAGLRPTSVAVGPA